MSEQPTAQEYINAQRRREIEAFENDPIAKGQQTLDFWWEQKLLAKTQGPLVRSEYSPVARLELELDDQQELADRAFARRLGYR
jgi:hypothetical protein